MSTNLEIFSNRPCSLGEAPLWHHQRQSLLWLDIQSNTLFEKSPSAEAREWNLPCTASLIVENEHSDSLVYLVTESGLASFDLNSSQFSIVQAISLGNTFRSNDGGVDPWGNLVFGSMMRTPQQGQGSIYRITPQRQVSKIASAIAIPNTFVWSKKGEYLYLSDSLQQTLFQISYSPQTALLEPFTPVIDLSNGPSTPDGGALDDDGNLWNAQWDGHRVARYSPNGKFLDAINLPVPRPTSCCFGGPENRHLFITSAKEGLNTQEIHKYPLSGATFCIELEVKGAALKPFALEQ